MLVCTHCTRSLRGVTLVGTPPAGSVPVSRGGRRGLAALVVLAIALGAALMAHRGLRSSPLEGDAAAASYPGGVKPPPTPGPDPGGWETLEQRFSALRPPTLEPSVLPSPSAPEPVPPLTTPSPLAAAASPPAQPPATAARQPVRASAAPAADDPDRALAERRGALRRAEERLERLERRADDLRAQLADEAARPEQRGEWEAALARVRQRVEEAAREIVRAEWALSEVER